MSSAGSTLAVAGLDLALVALGTSALGGPVGLIVGGIIAIGITVAYFWFDIDDFFQINGMILWIGSRHGVGNIL